MKRLVLSGKLLPVTCDSLPCLGFVKISKKVDIKWYFDSCDSLPCLDCVKINKKVGINW